MYFQLCEKSGEANLSQKRDGEANLSQMGNGEANLSLTLSKKVCVLYKSAKWPSRILMAI